MTAPRVAVLLLAAGASRRMGGTDKLTEPIAGVPLLRRAALTALESTAAAVVAVLGAHAEARRKALNGLAVTFAKNPVWETGIASSIRAGLAALPADADAAIIMLSDMPEVDTALLDRLIGAFDPAGGTEIVRPRAPSGEAGNPALFGRRLFPALRTISGDTGAREVIAAHRSVLREIPAEDGVLLDLDTPEDWARWRNGNNG